MSELRFFMADTASGARIAYRRRSGTAQGPTLIFLGGFHSDMTGSKAQATDAYCEKRGFAFVRFDYFGHGASDGAFELGNISRWKADALAVIDALSEGPLVLIGSSMGGWISLLAAIERPERVKAMCLIAPAPDFTEDLMWAGFSPHVRAEIETTGQWMRPSAYGDAPYPITRQLIEDGRNNLILRNPIPFEGPVRILHGQCDADVPWQRSLDLAERLTSRDVRLYFVKSGDHRLSTPDDLSLLAQTLDELLQHKA